MNEPTHLDIFSGIGGFSLAFESEGFRTIGFSEIDPYASAVLRKHWPDVPNFGDVRKLCRRAFDCDPDESGEPHCGLCNESFGECACVGADQFTDEHGWPDIITAGFPCQDISLNGHGAGLAGERSGLWFEAFRIVSELMPRFVLIENVASLRIRGADRVMSDLEGIGYACQAFMVGAWSARAQHRRNRAWIVAHASGERVERVRTERIEVARPLGQALLPLRNGDGQWEAEPDIRRAVHGVSSPVDRIRCLGNSIVPQVAKVFAKDIMKELQRANAVD